MKLAIEIVVSWFALLAIVAWINHRFYRHLRLVEPTPEYFRLCERHPLESRSIVRAAVWCQTHAVYLCHECIEAHSLSNDGCFYLSLLAAEEYVNQAMIHQQWSDLS